MGGTLVRVMTIAKRRYQSSSYKDKYYRVQMPQMDILVAFRPDIIRVRRVFIAEQIKEVKK